MNLSSKKVQLIKYVCDELSYAKIVYGVSQGKFAWRFGIPFIGMYVVSLAFCFYSSFTLKASTFFHLIVFLVFANYIWFLCCIILRSQRQKKWLKSYKKDENIEFADALFIYRIEKINAKIQEIGINEKDIDLMISDLDAHRNDAIFRVSLFVGLIGGTIALSNDSIKVILGAYLGTSNPVVISICHIGFLLFLTPLVYFFIVNLYKLEHGKWPLKNVLKNILLEIRLNSSL